MTTQQRTVLAVLCFTLATACGTARFVVIDSPQSVIAIPDNTQLHRDVALEMMASHCPAGYAIDREEEVHLGDYDDTYISTSADDEGLAITHSSSTERLTEWQITFHCAGSIP